MSVHSRTEVKKTPRGAIYLVALEHYLRDDLPCTHESCLFCHHLFSIHNGPARGRLRNSSNLPIIIPHASAILQQMDVMERLENVLMLQTALKKIRSEDAATYERVRELVLKRRGKAEGSVMEVDDMIEADGGTGNDWTVFSNENRKGSYVERLLGERNEVYEERLMVNAVNWLTQHWRAMIEDGTIREILVVRGSHKEATASAWRHIERARVVTVRELVHSTRRDLAELYAERDGDEAEEMETGDQQDSKKRRRQIFPDYLRKRKACYGVKRGRLYQGVYHPSPYNFRESFASVRMDPNDKSKLTRVLLSGREAQNRAIDCDIVVVELFPKSEWLIPSKRAAEQQDEVEEDEDKLSKEPENASARISSGDFQKVPTGKVVAISRRNWRPYCGAISSMTYTGGDRALFVPIDRKIPRIRVRSRRIPELIGKRLMVIIDNWDRRSAYPNGHVVKEIGDSGDKEAETQVLLIENGIPTRKFSDKAMACLPDANWAVTPEHVKTRWDLRGTTICSVDPPGCTDIDDALHFKRISPTEVEVGVHIADVTAFVRHDSALDKEAAERGTTVYLVDRRIEMLPALLSSNLCSLKADVERLAFSCIVRMDNEGNVLDSTFGRSIIKSRAALTYAAAQERIDAARKRLENGLSVDDPISESLVGLASIAAKLRTRRMSAGALILASPEPKFKISEETDAITDVHVYETRETNRVVEEFMLLANVVVANRILRQFPHCAILRRHPKPSQEMFEPLLRTAKAVGVKLDVTNSKRLNESLAQIAEDAKKRGDEYLGTLFRILATRCMTQAVYFSSGEVSNPEFLHYGLAAPVYTHFTSPIRRYADVLVHRLLSSCLGYSSLPMNLQDSKRMQELADVVNERHRCAQYASRASVVLHTVLLFKDKILEEPGRILRVLANGLVVLISRYGVEGVVQIDEDQKPILDDLNQTLTTKNGRVFKILESVRVRIRVDTAPERRDRVLYELA